MKMLQEKIKGKNTKKYNVKNEKSKRIDGNEMTPSRSRYLAGENPTSIAIGDFNNDKKLDLAAPNTSANMNSITVLFGAGDGKFRNQTTYPIFIIAADVNNDDRQDLVVTNMDNDTISEILGNENGTFRNQTQYYAGGSPSSITANNFSNDKNIDLTVTNYDKGAISMLHGDGNQTFHNRIICTVGLARVFSDRCFQRSNEVRFSSSQYV